MAASGLSAAQAAPPSAIRVLMDRGPTTLNPRQAGDATSQRLGALLYRALTRIDADLEPQGDLSSGWRILDGGRTWEFAIRPGLKDHAGGDITPASIARCLEGYREGKPTYLMRSAFPGWLSTAASDRAVTLRFDNATPYLARNLSLLRYFTPEGGAPCSEPALSQPIVGSGPYRLGPREPGDPLHESALTLVPVEPLAQGRGPLRFLFVPDDNTRLLTLLRGDADATQTGLPLSKTHWLREKHSDRFDFLEREGVNVSYLAFNLRDPILSRHEVRRAIALAIDRDTIIRHKLRGFCSKAGSLLSPRLPESRQSEFAHDPALAERLLDQAGYPRPRPGAPRFELRYRTTPVREGFETGLMIQDMLGRIGIRLVIDSVEPAVFLASIRKGAFQLYSSRWIGVSDGSILHRTLRSGRPDNRAGYRSEAMDRLLDQAEGETDPRRRAELLDAAQKIMAEDLPYFPLWYWNTTLVTRKGIGGLRPGDLSLSAALEPITRLKRLPK